MMTIHFPFEFKFYPVLMVIMETKVNSIIHQLKRFFCNKFENLVTSGQCIVFLPKKKNQ